MISIIIPVFNTSAYLDQCLKSVLEQTYTDWECIVVDDGSTDNSGEICDKWAEKDSRFIIVHQKNNGVSAARNRGIEKSRGEYICFIDSDDWVEPDYLNHLQSGIKDSEIDMVVTGSIYETSKPEIHAPQQKSIIRVESEYTKTFIEHVGLFYGPCAILYRSTLIKSNHITFPERLSFGEDTTFVFSYLQNVRDIVLAPFADYHYRISESTTLSYRFGEAKTLIRYDLWKMRESFYKEKDMWNVYSQKNMFRELWAIVYDGIFSTPNPSFSFFKKLLNIPEITYLKDWDSLFSTSSLIKLGIKHRAYRLFYLARKIFIR